jgi:hypothetical protein
MVFVERTTDLENHLGAWTHLMALLGDEAEMDALFDPFGDSANLDAR